MLLGLLKCHLSNRPPCFHRTEDLRAHVELAGPEAVVLVQLLCPRRGHGDARRVLREKRYRRTFTVPVDWNGREVFLRFDGVYSAYYVWVNGEKVGYAEDSKLPSEFNITKYLNPQPSTPNLLAVDSHNIFIL